MSDETDEPEKVDPAVRRRQQAQGAAGDLARMGIDPRSLGLGQQSSAQADPTPEPVPDLEEGGSVVPLRPQFRTLEPQGPAATPEVPADRTVEPSVPPAPTAPAPLEPVPSQRPDAGRLLRTVVRGLVTPDGAEAMQGERALIDAVRQRQSDRRVIAFIAGKGGVGCTTTALAVGTTFMALRDDASVLVDVQQGTPSLGLLGGASSPASVSTLVAETELVEPPVAASGLGLVDGAGWDQSLTRADISGVLERLGGEHSFNLLDVGDDAGEGGHAALARADQVVVITGPGRLGVAALESATERLRQVNPLAAERLVTVVVCPSEEAHRETVRELGPGQPRVVVVPPDAALRDGEPYDPGRVGGATREAFLRVAAGIAGR